MLQRQRTSSLPAVAAAAALDLGSDPDHDRRLHALAAVPASAHTGIHYSNDLNDSHNASNLINIGIYDVSNSIGHAELPASTVFAAEDSTNHLYNPEAQKYPSLMLRGTGNLPQGTASATVPIVPTGYFDAGGVNYRNNLSNTSDNDYSHGILGNPENHPATPTAATTTGASVQPPALAYFQDQSYRFPSPISSPSGGVTSPTIAPAAGSPRPPSARHQPQTAQTPLLLHSHSVQQPPTVLADVERWPSRRRGSSSSVRSAASASMLPATVPVRIEEDGSATGSTVSLRETRAPSVGGSSGGSGSGLGGGAVAFAAAAATGRGAHPLMTVANAGGTIMAASSAPVMSMSQAYRGRVQPSNSSITGIMSPSSLVRMRSVSNRRENTSTAVAGASSGISSSSSSSSISISSGGGGGGGGTVEMSAGESALARFRARKAAERAQLQGENV
ncbi:hypothetical protein HDU84_000804 [Entophlyctis sp. JEL0112]|nr:hypothetical protein HDU84_000804 [Entophlyctis sp. JEL0112]